MLFRSYKYPRTVPVRGQINRAIAILRVTLLTSLFTLIGPPCDRVQVPTKAQGGYTHVLVAIDKFTNCIEFKPVACLTSAKAVEFIQDIIFRFGIPIFLYFVTLSEKIHI